jgi:uncharacterized protein YbbC (DUF1343 family)
LCVLVKLYSDKIKFNESFDKLAGSDILRKQLLDKIEPEKIIASWQKELIKFGKKRYKYLLY